MVNYVAVFRRKLTAVLTKLFFALVDKMINSKAKRFTKISSRCRVACNLNVWAKISNSKPVDFESSLYQEMDKAVTFYLMQSFTSRDSIGLLEGQILRYNYLFWIIRKNESDKRKQYYRFVLKYRIADILKNYVNIQNCINKCATDEISELESKLGIDVSAEFWTKLVLTDKLPAQLRKKCKPRSILSYLKKEIKTTKRDLSYNNYLKFDFSPSDITAFVSLSGTLLLLLGYLQVAAVNSYFGVPYQRYFGISDYIASSVSAVDNYLVAALIAFLFVFLSLATANTVSLYSAKIEERSSFGSIDNWFLHFTGLSALAAMTAVFFTKWRIEPIMLFVTCMYLGAPMVRYFCLRFFVSPPKAYMFSTLVFVAFVNGGVGVVTEINHVIDSKGGPPVRIFKFVDADYTEPDWFVLAITSDFVILRRQNNGFIQVRAKSDLKLIEDVIEDS